MDGVLVDNNKYHNIAWIEFCKRRNLQISEAEVVKRFGNQNIEYFKFLFGNHLSDEEYNKLGEEKEAIYREIYEKDIKPAQGLVKLLESLKEKGFKLAVATSAIRNNLDFVLDKTNIRGFFNAFVDASMVANGKPNPEVFVKTAGMLGVHPSDCLVFEDSVHGVEAAHSAGMKVIAITSTFEADQLKLADRIIKGFPEITSENIVAILKS